MKDVILLPERIESRITGHIVQYIQFSYYTVDKYGCITIKTGFLMVFANKALDLYKRIITGDIEWTFGEHVGDNKYRIVLIEPEKIS